MPPEEQQGLVIPEDVRAQVGGFGSQNRRDTLDQATTSQAEQLDFSADSQATTSTSTQTSTPDVGGGSFLSNTVNAVGTSGLADLVPSGEIGEGLAAGAMTAELPKPLEMVFGKRELHVQQQEISRQKNQLIENARVNLAEAREAGDEESIARSREILKDAAGVNTDLAADILEGAPTQTQILGDAAELATFAAIGGRFGQLKGPVAKMSENLFGGSRVARALGDVTKSKFVKGKSIKDIAQASAPYLRESAIGAPLAASLEAQKEDASLEDIRKAGEFGALIGPAFIAGGKMLGAGYKKTKNALAPKLKSAVEKMEKNARKTLQKAEEPMIFSPNKTVKDQILSTMGTKKGFNAAVARGKLGVVDQMRKIKTGWLDRFASLKRFEKRMSETLGRPLKDSEKVYRDIRTFASRSGHKAQERYRSLAEKLKPYADMREEYTTYLGLLDYGERAKFGMDVPGGYSEDQLKAMTRKFFEEAGPETSQRLGAVRSSVREYHAKLLNDRVKSGLISKDEAARIATKHQDYIPHNVLFDADEQALDAVGKSFNVSDNKLKKAMGSMKNIDDPIAAMQNHAIMAERVMEKNRILNNFVDAQQEHKVFEGMKKLKAGQKADEGFGTISLMRDGTKERWQVPKDVELGIQGDLSFGRNAIGKMMEGVNKTADVLRKGATQLNLSFSLPNMFRDRQTAAITANSFIKDLKDRYGVIGDDVMERLSKEGIEELYQKSGGYGASVFKDGDDWMFDKLEQGGIATKIKDKNPMNVVKKINDEIEIQTRMDVFKKGLQEGLDPKDAALASRDATIDFQKMGTYMEPINRAVPFLNARVQGLANTVRAADVSPEMFARSQLYTSVYPTLLLEQHNSRYESSNNISRYMKDRYWNIVVGETKAKSKYNGEEITVPHYISIPKGEAQVLVSSPLQWALDQAKGESYRDVKEMIVDTLGNASPLAFQSFSRDGNPLMSLAGQMGPLPRAGIGWMTNKDPFTGRDVIPEDRRDLDTELQAAPTTPESTQRLANMIGIAPARVELILNSFGAGLAKDAQDAADITFGLINQDNLKDDLSDEALTETTWGIGSRTPIARRFVREADEFYSPESEFRKRQLNHISRDVQSRKQKFIDRAEEHVQQINRFDTGEEFDNYMAKHSDEMSDRMLNEIHRIKTQRRAVEVLGKNTPTEERARYILTRMDEMKQRGVEKESIADFVDALIEEEILTEKTQQIMSILLKNREARIKDTPQQPRSRFRAPRGLPGM